MRYQQQKYREECYTTIAKVKSEQEEFLVNEIMVLKKEFNNDLTEVTRLHKVKEDEYLARINDYVAEIQRVKVKMGNLTQQTLQQEQDSNTSKAQAARYKKQVI